MINVLSRLPIWILLSTLPGWAMAQNTDVPTRAQKALAAGYTAMFTCSATFNGGKDKTAITAHELTHAYPDYADAFAAIGESRINRSQKYVSVSFADDMPPRIAAWRPHLGCSALPSGANSEFIGHLPRIDVKPPSDTQRHDMWPMGDTLPNTPLPQGINRSGLETQIDAAFAGDFSGQTSAVLVMQNGRLISERYLDGFTHETSQRTWSVAKSIGASVIGIAVKQGKIDITQPTGLSAWSRPGDPRADITLENLLHMSSGLNSEPAGNRTDQIYFGGGLAAQHATRGALEAPPGQRWRYANNDTMLAMRTLRETMNDDAAYWRFPFTQLLHKIGMYNTVPEMDWGGDFILSSQVWTTARDLARLGQLYLNQGVWNGKQILPENWAQYVAAPAPAQPPNRAGEKAQTPGRGYGAQFWRYENYPGVPAGTYAALGNRGQFVIIVPTRNTVIVRRGYDYRGNYFDGPAFTAAVLKNLE